ncbi:MAG: prephenate dehydratase [Leptolyngbya sp. IPPAS B-1204]
MATSIAHLGPSGTYAESAALACAQLFSTQTGEEYILCPYPSIIQTIYAVANQQTRLGVVPVENSIEGGVGATLDTLWQLDTLQIQQALVLPISHALLSCASSLGTIQTVYSHPQALAQCQGWLTKYLPTAQLIPTNSTTEALQFLNQSSTIAAIAPQRAAQLYNLPVLAYPINDHPDNCTRFWVLSLDSSSVGSHTSLAFSIPANVPGRLSKRYRYLPNATSTSVGLNLAQPNDRWAIISFVDIEASLQSDAVQSALLELQHETESLKVFGSYTIQTVDLSLLFASQQQG